MLMLTVRHRVQLTVLSLRTTDASEPAVEPVFCGCITNRSEVLNNLRIVSRANGVHPGLVNFEMSCAETALLSTVVSALAIHVVQCRRRVCVWTSKDIARCVHCTKLAMRRHDCSLPGAEQPRLYAAGNDRVVRCYKLGCGPFPSQPDDTIECAAAVSRAGPSGCSCALQHTVQTRAISKGAREQQGIAAPPCAARIQIVSISLPRGCCTAECGPQACPHHAALTSYARPLEMLRRRQRAGAAWR